MTSKELNEILNKTRRTPNISLTPEQVEELVKDLEDYEELKKLMGMPIQDIMKRLEVLETIKNSGYSVINKNNGDFILCFNAPDNDTINKIKEWLNNGK